MTNPQIRVEHTSKADSDKNQSKEKQAKKLEKGLTETFPASDPPAATIPTIADRPPRKS